MLKKELIYIDLDGVIIDSAGAIATAHESGGRVSLEECPPVAGALEALHKLSKRYSLHVLSTARWSDPDNWGDRLIWLKANGLEELLFKRLTLTHHKNLFTGRALIDDRTANGAGEFKGEHIHFGTLKYPTWERVVEYLMKPREMKPSLNLVNFPQNNLVPSPYAFEGNFGSGFTRK
jgi:5'-nucleotidase